jgi:hypothetical protein
MEQNTPTKERTMNTLTWNKRTKRIEGSYKGYDLRLGA